MFKSIAVNVFLSSIVLTLQAMIATQLDIVRKNNTPEFYKDLLITGWKFFKLLGNVQGKVLAKGIEIFTVPIFQAASVANIPLD